MTKGEGDARAPAMEGGGFYNRHSAMQAAGIGLLSDMWTAACDGVVIDADATSLTIADYGSSQGRNSMAPVRAAIDALRARSGWNVPIEVVHTDLASNDFSALFTTLETEPGSYLAGRQSVFPSAIGRSFYEVLFPPDRVHLGWSTWALQWMSRSPVETPDHVIAGLSAVPEVNDGVRTQQAADWRQFLGARAVELRSGGRLVLGFTARSAAETGWEWLLGELWAAVLDLVEAGHLSRETSKRITIPIGFRTLDDLAEPFTRHGSFSGLRAERLELFEVADLFWDEYQRSGDAASFAQRHADTTRAWAGPTIAAMIAESNGGVDLTGRLFARFSERLAQNPRPHRPYMAAALIARTG